MRKFLAPLVLTVVLVGAAGIAAWQPWASKEREQEIEWLEDFDAWADRADAGAANCRETFEKDVGEPPARLAEAHEIALSGCGDATADWNEVRGSVLTALIDQRTDATAPRPDAELAARARPFAGGDLAAFCWTKAQWEELQEESAIVRTDEFRPMGFADLARDRIHLAPEVCRPLHRFFGSDYAPAMSEEALHLAIALVTLAHEAEHLRSPDASEAAVECVAIQRVRDLVRDAGRGASYQELMAGLAWDVGYPDVPPEYRTDSCLDGGELDVRPDTSVWP